MARSRGTKTITSVYIPDSIVTIGANAFEGSDLLQVSGMQKVTSMGAYAFANTDLTAFTIPSGLVALPEGALMNTRITGIVIPTTLTSIGAKAFAAARSSPITRARRARVRVTASRALAPARSAAARS